MDKLGTSARLGIDLVVRQTFYWGHYALLDTDFTPRPVSISTLVKVQIQTSLHALLKKMTQIVNETAIYLV